MTTKLTLLALFLLPHLAAAVSATKNEGWPGPYPDFCGGTGYGKTSQLANGMTDQTSYTDRINSANKRLKYLCTEFRPKLLAKMKSSAAGCKAAPATLSAYQSRLDSLCKQSQYSANKAVETCVFYDKQGVDAEIKANKAAQGVGSQAGSYQAATSAIDAAMAAYLKVKAEAEEARTNILHQAASSTGDNSAVSNQDEKIQSILQNFQSSAGNDPKCADFSKTLKPAGRLVTNNILPNIRVLGDGMSGIVSGARQRHDELEALKARLDKFKNNLNDASGAGQGGPPALHK
jgi:hypothetical protein